MWTSIKNHGPMSLARWKIIRSVALALFHEALLTSIVWNRKKS